MRTIETLLVANRGEIARRVLRTCRALGIRGVAVYSEADRDLAWVDEADEAVCLGPAEPAQSYLDVDALLAAAAATGAQAIHPGYGFLSESAAFASAVEAAGLVWVGPPASAIEAMGEKAAARRAAVACGVPVVPGYDGDDDDATLIAEAERLGVPLLVKASAGGGGRGMRRVDDLADLPDALASARREAASSFGSDRLLLERYVQRPRHLEVQVFGDAHGHVIHLGERECSVQRRHQKVFEEAPSPAVDDALRAALGDAAVRVAEAVGYVGAGTVEFVLGADGAFHFLEMNTRLQVEHPVTEAVTGVDLVAWQIAVAEGRPLPMTQDEVALRGHAIEARVIAEDPSRDWMPASGRLVRCAWPAGEGVRVDAGYRDGDVVPSSYDALLGKVITWGDDRAQANRRLQAALDAAWVPGVVTNLPLLRDVVRDEAWRAGDLHTGFFGAQGLPRTPPANLVDGARVAAVWGAWRLRSEAVGPTVPLGWRLTGPAPVVSRWTAAGDEVEVRVVDRGEALEVAVGDVPAERVHVRSVDGDRMVLSRVVDGLERVQAVRVAVVDGAPGVQTLYVHLGWGEAMVTSVPRFPAPAGLADDPGSLSAPTPGVVRVVHVAVGDVVERGQPLVVLEAMKMEQVLAAPADGTVTSVRCAVGDAVDGGALLIQLDAAESD